MLQNSRSIFVYFIFVLRNWRILSSCAKDERKAKEQNERPHRILSYERLKSTDSKRSASFHSSARLPLRCTQLSASHSRFDCNGVAVKPTRRDDGSPTSSATFANVRFNSRRSGSARSQTCLAAAAAAVAAAVVALTLSVLSVNRFRYVASALRLITQLCCQHSKSACERDADRECVCVSSSECNLAVIV